MPRLMLSDEFWSKLEKILLQETIYNKRNLRMTVEGMLYRMRVGCPWRDLPKAFGSWNSIYKRFSLSRTTRMIFSLEGSLFLRMTFSQISNEVWRDCS